MTESSKESAWRFEVRTFHRSAGACEGPEGCAVVLASWPQARRGPQGADLAALNEALAEMVARGAAPDDEPPPTLELQAESFLQDWRRARREHPDAASTAAWSLEKDLDVIDSTAGWVSVRLREVRATGGAHPNAWTRLTSLDAVDGEPLHFEEVFLADHSAALDRLGEKALRRARMLPPDVDLAEAGFRTEGGFRLNDNFALAAAGVVFHFDRYEIAPYSMGPSELTLRWKEVEAHLRPEFRPGAPSLASDEEPHP